MADYEIKVTYYIKLNDEDLAKLPDDHEEYGVLASLLQTIQSRIVDGYLQGEVSVLYAMQTLDEAVMGKYRGMHVRYEGSEEPS